MLHLFFYVIFFYFRYLFFCTNKKLFENANTYNITYLRGLFHMVKSTFFHENKYFLFEIIKFVSNIKVLLEKVKNTLKCFGGKSHIKSSIKLVDHLGKSCVCICFYLIFFSLDIFSFILKKNCLRTPTLNLLYTIFERAFACG